MIHFTDLSAVDFSVKASSSTLVVSCHLLLNVNIYGLGHCVCIYKHCPEHHVKMRFWESRKRNVAQREDGAVERRQSLLEEPGAGLYLCFLYALPGVDVLTKEVL